MTSFAFFPVLLLPPPLSLCSADLKHAVWKLLRLQEHSAAAHGYLSDSLFYSQTPFLLLFPLSLSFSLFSCLSLSLSLDHSMQDLLHAVFIPPFLSFSSFSLFASQTPLLSPLSLLSPSLSLFWWLCLTVHALGNKTDNINRGMHLTSPVPYSCQSKGQCIAPSNSAKQHNKNNKSLVALKSACFFSPSGVFSLNVSFPLSRKKVWMSQNAITKHQHHFKKIAFGWDCTWMEMDGEGRVEERQIWHTDKSV